MIVDDGLQTHLLLTTDISNCHVQGEATVMRTVSQYNDDDDDDDDDDDKSY